MITVARFTPLPLDAVASASLSSLFICGLASAALVTLMTLIPWFERRANAAARRLRQVNRDIDRWIDEDAPRPKEPA